MKFEEYRQMDGVALAEAVQKKEVTPAELLHVAIQRAEQVNPTLNGLIIPLYEEGRKSAQAPGPGALHGVPMLAKDYGQEMKGAPHYMGTKGLKRLGRVAEEDSELVKRWREGGLVIFGRTSTPELAIKAITEPKAWGPTRNPWNINHTPGGSSGGSAALVAAGVVPIAGANDGGGSIRIPAGACGLFGLKPGRGRIPWGGKMTEAMHGMAINHVLTRSVRDSAMMLDISHGEEPGSMAQLAKPEDSFYAATQQDVGKLKIAFSTRSPVNTKVDPEAIKAVENAVKLLADLGHHVEEAEPAIDGEEMMRAWLRMWFVNCAATVNELRASGLKADDFELDTMVMAAVGNSISASEYVQGYYDIQQYGRQWDHFMQGYDFWLTPTLGMPPAAIGALETPPLQQKLASLTLKMKGGGLLKYSGLLERLALENLQYTPYTQMANATGVPAMSVPLHWCENGLPLGVQFMGVHGDEAKLLSLAAQLEQAQPWFDKVPAEL